MKLRRRKNVALLIESSRSYGRGIMRGVALYSRTLGHWALLHEEMTIDAVPPEWLARANLSGVIGRIDEHSIGPLRELQIPLVDVRCRRNYEGIPQVETDDSQVAQLAFEHLFERGFRQFAFCGYAGAHYSEIRLRHFRALVERAGCPLQVYETPGSDRSSLTTIERSGLLDADEMTAWLSRLSHPTGLLVCNDIRGQQVLNACRALQISVPDDLGVIGVDDDDAICPLCDPPLSSVRPNTEGIGYRAAQILDAMMHGSNYSDKMIFLPPESVSQRLSTQGVAIHDREVARICRFIREHACDGVDVGDVVDFSQLSRRQLERRFHRLLGRTLHDEITEVQVRKVKQLLAETDLTLEQIAPLAGYRHKERLSSVFKRTTGETAGQYRARVAPRPIHGDRSELLP